MFAMILILSLYQMPSLECIGDEATDACVGCIDDCNGEG